VELYQIIQFFDQHSSYVLAFSTIPLVVITAYYALQTRALTRNQRRPAFSLYLGGISQNNVTFDIILYLKNAGLGAGFNIRVEYSIKGVAHSRQTKIIRLIERDQEYPVALVQNDQSLQHDRNANRLK
jgi:hypothetical protein